MKIAIVGSRGIKSIKLDKYVSNDDEIISGGAKGVDSLAADYARRNNIRLTEILPQYEKYKRAAPIIRNREIVDLADCVIAFWDGESRGTLSVINYAKKVGKECRVIIEKDGE